MDWVWLTCCVDGDTIPCMSINGKTGKMESFIIAFDGVLLPDGKSSAGLVITGVPIGSMGSGKIDLIHQLRGWCLGKGMDPVKVKTEHWSNPHKADRYEDLSPVMQQCVAATMNGWGMYEGNDGLGKVIMAAEGKSTVYDGQQHIIYMMLKDSAKQDGCVVRQWYEVVDGVKLKTDAVLV